MTTCTNVTSPYFNPDTPMVSLPPDSAEQYVAGTYVAVAVIGAWFMDVFLSIPDEIRIYRNRSFKLPDLMYFLSRIISGGYFLTGFVILATPLHSCALVLSIAVWFGLTTPLNSSLFLLRVCGVFHEYKIVIGFFSFLWLGTFTSFASIFHVKMHVIETTKYCAVEFFPQLISLVFIVAVAYDTLVFLAITCWTVQFKGGRPVRVYSLLARGWGISREPCYKLGKFITSSLSPQTYS